MGEADKSFCCRPPRKDKQTPPARNSQSAKLPQLAAKTAEVFWDCRKPPQTKRQFSQTSDFSKPCDALQIALTPCLPPHMRRLSRHFCRKKFFPPTQSPPNGCEKKRRSRTRQKRNKLTGNKAIISLPVCAFARLPPIRPGHSKRKKRKTPLPRRIMFYLLLCFALSNPDCKTPNFRRPPRIPKGFNANCKSMSFCRDSKAFRLHCAPKFITSRSATFHCFKMIDAGKTFAQI